MNRSPGNIWDIFALIIILGVLTTFAWASSDMHLPFQLGQSQTINLEASSLPGYALNTTLRMFIALGFSLLFTFIVAPLAAKNKHFERIIIPFIDLMESVPILGFLAITIVFFINLFPGSNLGPESAAIFVIFTSQVWNMTLSLYQSLCTVPKELIDVAKSFHLSSWQRFWRIEVPYAVPGLLWNIMMSMSAGWFFIAFSEAITVAGTQIMLPGIGSYISLATIQQDFTAIFYAIITMFVVIIIYDQLLFRPLIAWSHKFQAEITEESESQESWFYNLLNKTKLLKKFGIFLANTFVVSKKYNIHKYYYINNYTFPIVINNTLKKLFVVLWNIFIAILVLYSCYLLSNFVLQAITFNEILYVLYLGAITAIKVTILVILASVVWIPIGVWIGLRPAAVKIFQPIAQIFAAFPANLLYPFVVFVILKYSLNVDIWTTPLMILGTQWYILFNVIAGTAVIPKDITRAGKVFGLRGMLWWRKLILPAIFPHYITGAMAAAGGCWNASIAADVVYWGENKLVATGLGSYIVQSTTDGDMPRTMLGIAMMSFYVIAINRLVWHKLYKFAELRFKLD